MTDNALAVRYTATDGTEVALDADYVNRYLVTGGSTTPCSDAEIVGFLNMCRASGANPLVRDAYLVKYGSQPATIILSKNYWTKVANSQPEYDGCKCGVIVEHADGSVEQLEGSFVPNGCKLVGGWADVYRKDRRFPSSDSVSLEEYGTGKSGWAKMPATMIRKVAFVHALREAFPEKLAGMYCEEEMEQANPDAPIPADAVVVETVESKPAPRQLTPEQRSTLQNITHLQAERLGIQEDIVKQEMMRALGNPLDAESFDDYVHAAEAWALEEMPTEVTW